MKSLSKNIVSVELVNFFITSFFLFKIICSLNLECKIFVIISSKIIIHFHGPYCMRQFKLILGRDHKSEDYFNLECLFKGLLSIL